MDKKYELLEDDTIKIEGKILYRIKALKDFNDIKYGELGGYIEKESNLSHVDNCWVYCSARVYGNARIFGNAQVYGNARIFGNAKVHNNAEVFGNAQVYGNARIFDNVCIYGNTEICSDASIHGKSYIYKGNIKNTSDCITIGPIGSRNDFTTFFLNNDTICISCGCFKGNIDEFESKVKETHKDNIHAKKYLATIQYVKSILN